MDISIYIYIYIYKLIVLLIIIYDLYEKLKTNEGAGEVKAPMAFIKKKKKFNPLPKFSKDFSANGQRATTRTN
jgi:hypothetical protein